MSDTRDVFNPNTGHFEQVPADSSRPDLDELFDFCVEARRSSAGGPPRSDPEGAVEDRPAEGCQEADGSEVGQPRSKGEDPFMRKPDKARRDPRTAEVLKALRAQGWKVEVTGHNHVRCVPPDKDKPAVVQSGTPGEYRAHLNWLAQLKRSGYRT